MPLIGTAELVARYGVSGAELWRWRDAEWVDAEPGPRGSGSRLRWAPWAVRMVAFLALPSERRRRRDAANRHGGRVHGLTPWDAYCDQTEALGLSLRAEPAAPWFVLVDGEMWDEMTAADAVHTALALATGPLRTIVSPPFA